MIGRLFGSRVALALIAAVAGAAIALCIAALIRDEEGPSKAGEVKLSFEQGPSEETDLLKGSGAFPNAVNAVNHEIDLPRDLGVRVVGPATASRVGITGPTYEPDDRTIYFPWSFVQGARKDLRRLPRFRRLKQAKLDRSLANAMTFVLYHELTHGLVDVLDVPVVAGEEETADNLAAIFAIASRPGGQVVPLSAAALEEAQARGKGAPTLSDYADDHGFDTQRAINALCLVYGSDTDRYQGLVDSGELPANRADKCEFEYREDLAAWRELLSEWLTKSGGLRPLD